MQYAAVANFILRRNALTVLVFADDETEETDDKDSASESEKQDDKDAEKKPVEKKEN